jgi:hypothetical protein
VPESGERGKIEKEEPTPTRVFLEKRLQTIENKGREQEKNKEAASFCKQKS